MVFGECRSFEGSEDTKITINRLNAWKSDKIRLSTKKIKQKINTF